MDRPLTVPEAAQRLGYHPDHMRRLITEGRVKAEKVAWRWLIPVSEVERVKAAQSSGGQLPKGFGQ